MRNLAGVFVSLFLSILVTGCAPRGASTPAQPSSKTGQPSPASVVTVVIREFEFEPRPLKVKAGMVRFQLMNRGSVEHDFAIPGLAGHNQHEQHLVKPGEIKIVELDLQPGTYEAICTIPGHKEAGMVVTVEVNS